MVDFVVTPPAEQANKCDPRNHPTYKGLSKSWLNVMESQAFQGLGTFGKELSNFEHGLSKVETENGRGFGIAISMLLKRIDHGSFCLDFRFTIRNLIFRDKA